MGNADVALSALGAVRGGDLETARRFVAEDFVWHIPGRGPISGDVTGLAGWHEKLSRLVAAGLQPELLGMLEGGDKVAVLQQNRATHGPHQLDVSVVNVFTISDARVRRLDTYFGDQYHADGFWTAVLG
ncbi:MAG TPA: nuclear transport factor 2 family protein [Mycobacteriales bacterium]|nr:nuclear transport factor 2 family protein [Mycobacteriales bacterium]